MEAKKFQRSFYKVLALIQRIRRKNSAICKKFRSKKNSAHFLQSFSANSAHPQKQLSVFEKNLETKKFQ